jgi:hypothetical protein
MHCDRFSLLGILICLAAPLLYCRHARGRPLILLFLSQPEFIESVPEYRSASPCQLPCSLVNMDTACQPLLCCDTDKATYGSDCM